MRTFVIYTRTTEKIVKADCFEITNNKLIVFCKDNEMVAMFNLENIDGFKEKL